MPRFVVAICDENTGEISVEFVSALEKHQAALMHSWFTEMYLPAFIQKHLSGSVIEEVVENVYNLTSWRLVCRNLDNAIMKDLNGGGSSASASQPTGTDAQ